MWAVLRLISACWVFGWIFASYLLQLGLQRLVGGSRVAHRWPLVHRRNARRMYRGFVRLRGVYIKLGQVLSIMGTFLPRAYVDELEGLQDTVPHQPYAVIAAAFQRAFGTSPTQAFRRFAEQPIAAASLGQVHEAESHAGERLAVKVLYPRVDTIIAIDVRVLGWALRLYRLFVPVQQLDRVLEQLRDMLKRETDLIHEAHCLERMARNFEGDPDVLFPKVHHELSSKHILTMSFMEGVKITRASALDELGLEPADVATKLVQVFYKQLFIDRFFHADPHPGNFFVQRGPAGQPRLVILDFGSSSEVTEALAEGMLAVLTGLMTRNDDEVVRGIETMGFVAEGGDRALLERTTRRYFEKLLNLNLQDFGRISPAQVQAFTSPEMKRDELRELMRSVQYPLGWFYIERAVIIMFGLSAQLAPKLNTLQVGFPFIMKFLAEQQAKKQADAVANGQRVAR